MDKKRIDPSAEKLDNLIFDGMDIDLEAGRNKLRLLVLAGFINSMDYWLLQDAACCRVRDGHYQNSKLWKNGDKS